MSQNIPLHKQFRSKRVQMEIKQSYLADKAGLDQGTVSRFESGKSANIGVENFVSLCMALDDHWDLELPGVQIILVKII